MASDALTLLLALEVQTLGTDLLEGLGSALEGIVGKAEGLGGVSGVLGDVGASLATVGVAAVGVGVAMGAAIGGLAAVAGQFDSMMVQARNNTTLTDADAQKMRDTVLSLGAQAPASLDALAQGFVHASNFGFDAADSTNILNVAMESALSTGGDVAKTTEILSAALHEFKIPASDAAHIMDQLHLAAAEGNMTLEQFTQSAGPVFAWAAAVGVPLDQASAAFAAMTRHGFDAAEAATQVKDLLEHMIKPTSAATAEVEKLAKASGMDLTDALSATNLHAKGLPGVLDELRGAMDKVGLSADQQTAEWMKLIPNIRGGAAAFVLTGQGTQDLASILGDLGHATGVTDDAYARLKETLPFQWGVLKNDVQETAISLGEALMPAVLSVVQSVIPLVQNVKEFITTHADLIASIAEGVTKFLLIAGAIMTVVGTVALITAVVDPLVLIIAAVGVVVSDLAESWGVNWESIQRVSGVVIDWVQGALYDLSVTLQAVIDIATGLLNDLGLTTTNVSAGIQGEFDNITGGLGGLESTFSNVLQSILSTVNSVGQSIHDGLSWLDPFAEHSPSLVNQVNDGVAAIVAAYVSTGRIQGPLQDTGAAIQQFASMGKDALTSLADTTKAQVDNLKGNLDELKAALAAAKQDLATLSSTPIQGTKAFEDQKFALEQQKEAIQLQIDQGKLAGKSDKDLKPLTDALAKLSLQADMVNLQEKLKLDPLKKQIAELAKPITEMPFDKIIQGIKDAQKNIATLTPAVATAQGTYDKLSGSLKGMSSALQEIAKNTKGAGGGANLIPKPEIPTPAMIQLVKDYNAAVTGGLHDIATQHQAAAEAAQHDADVQNKYLRDVATQTGTLQQTLATIATTFGTVRDAATTTFNGILNTIKTTLTPATDFIQSEVNTITNWWTMNLPLLNETAQTVMNAIHSIFETGSADGASIWRAFGSTITGILNAAGDIWNSVMQVKNDAINQTIGLVWTLIKITIDTGLKTILALITATMDAINGHWSAAWTAIHDMLQNDWNAMGDVVKVGVNAIIGYINDLIAAWDSLHFSIPGFNVTLPGGKVIAWNGLNFSPTPIAPIPTLDTGGIVTGPTLAMLSANSVPEVVAPLPALQSMLGGRGGGGPSVIHVHLEGGVYVGNMHDLARKISREVNQQYALVGRHA